MTNTFIEENEQFIASLPVLSGTAASLAVRLIHANDRLSDMIKQAEAQFAVGDTHATFNKQLIEKINEPLFIGKPKKQQKS